MVLLRVFQHLHDLLHRSVAPFDGTPSLAFEGSANYQTEPRVYEKCDFCRH